MEKLLMLKEWLTLDEAATRFSTTAKESVTQADILRLALDNHLQLSVFIDDTLIAREMEFETEIVDGEKNLMLGDGSSEAVRINGVWDLAAYGVGASELERLYRESKGLKPRNGLFSSAGLYLHDEDKTSVMEVLSISLKFKFVDKARHAAKDTTGVVSSDSVVGSPSLTVKADPSMLVDISKMLKNGLADYEPVIDESIYAYYRETSFPDACLIVIRKDELIAFERKHLGGSIKAELTPTERESSHQIIASLSAMAGIDLSAPYKAVEILRQAAATHGLELPASAETIVKFLAGPNRKKR
ncbi:hypothetical protein [Pseudomonas sp. TH31]|uniref:hypothetical protein n=1 Tax=Pseudomonas sp. TH31 TaxID=2796396 RepID=UPI00191401C1|nr:hypothetical protein [Pseudomonas sp. TH31]MBK5415612.1 hypothetical protein [Pseudomonas sp. TH31]